MKKQNVETIVLKNAKTGVAEKIQHECHNTGYGTKHFWKADAKFFELLSNFSAAESKVLAYILQETQPTKNKFVGAYKTIARKLNCDVVTVRNTVKKIVNDAGNSSCCRVLLYATSVSTSQQRCLVQICISGSWWLRCQ